MRKTPTSGSVNFSWASRARIARRVVSPAVRWIAVPQSWLNNVEAIDDGEADMVGIGRPFYAEPDLAARILAGGDTPPRCQYSNLCVPAQMLGMKGVCYNPAVTRQRAGAEPR